MKKIFFCEYKKTNVNPLYIALIILALLCNSCSCCIVHMNIKGNASDVIDMSQTPTTYFDQHEVF